MTNEIVGDMDRAHTIEILRDKLWPDFVHKLSHLALNSN